jgi:SAM-dependent methyltransferase
VSVTDERRIMRRVGGPHNYRLDGIGDLLTRARGASVMDLGCNRGQVGHDFVLNGAITLHGCDIDEDSVAVARKWFIDFKQVQSRFEVLDLTAGPKSLEAFGAMRYDIILMLATYHKIKRQMPAKLLSELSRDLARRTIKYFAWRGTSEDRPANEAELVALDVDLKAGGLRRIHTSYLSETLGVAAIWARP